MMKWSQPTTPLRRRFFWHGDLQKISFLRIFFLGVVGYYVLQLRSVNETSRDRKSRVKFNRSGK
jgi:hypothetical protein